MKILGIFLNNEIRTGGHIRALELFELLGEKGHDVTVLLNTALEYTPRHFTGERLNAAYTRRSFIPASLVFKRAAASWVKTATEQYDIILTFSETHYSAASCIKRKLKIPVLFALQSNAVKEVLISAAAVQNPAAYAYKKLVEYNRCRMYERKIAGTCDGIVFQSSFDRDDFVSRNRGAKNKTFVIGGNIGKPRFTDETEGINKSTRLEKILFMGTLGERKGLRYLIDAFKLLHENNYRNLELHIAGPGSAKDQKAFTDELEAAGLADKAFFYGRVPSVFPLMESCDLMVVPSIFDSYPDVILLALHAGIPVIASNTGGIPDILVFEDLLFTKQSGPAMYEKISRCVDDPDVYLRARNLCTERRSAFHFDWSERWLDVMKAIKERQ